MWQRRQLCNGLRQALGLLALLLPTTLAVTGCERTEASAYAIEVQRPEELIGGPGALGTTGDYLLGNDQIRVVIQNQGWSRGFGVFGGGIIDADWNRPGTVTGQNTGNDRFGEFFPAMFLQAMEVKDVEIYDAEQGDFITHPGIEIMSDGSDGGPAIIRTRALGGHFLTMISKMVDLALSSSLVYETDYILHPGKRYVEIVGRIRNETGNTISLPLETVNVLPEGMRDVQVPLGDVTLFGAGNRVFVPGAIQRLESASDPRLAPVKGLGFDLEFGLQAAYKHVRQLPALGGVVTDLIATAGDGVSYGFAVGDSDNNYVWQNRDQYGSDPQAAVTKHSLLIPFSFSAFTGAYYELPPSQLADGDAYEYRKYFIVGQGDVASVRDSLYDIRGETTGRLSGEVFREQAGSGVADASLLIFDANKRPYSQVQVDHRGQFNCRLPVGTYYYTVMAPGRQPFPAAPMATTSPEGAAAFDSTRFEVRAGVNKRLLLRLPEASSLAVRVRDNTGRIVPAKVRVVSHFDPKNVGLLPRDFLFDLAIGESRRRTDMSWIPEKQAASNKVVAADTVAPTRFIEKTFYVQEGRETAQVRPNRCAAPSCAYDIYVSRGMEYELGVTRGVFLRPGEHRDIDITLPRAFETPDWVGADLHVHAENSVDSSVPMGARALSAAAEGVEVLVGTDHNFVTDYAPVIQELGLQDFVRGMVGVELSTLEAGHFNGFPLRYDLNTPPHFPFVDYCYRIDSELVNETAFDWVQCSPHDLFANLRKLGSLGPEQTIVQINHPRTSITGYFNQYSLNPYTAAPDNALADGDNYPTAAQLVYPDRPTGQFRPEAFSFDFDAIELFNGKRRDRLHAFRLPKTASAEVVASKRTCKSGHNLNGAGQVLLRKGGHITHPGAVDDWFNFLRAGHRYVATGNSDTHSLEGEVGAPRTYVKLPRDGSGAPRDRHPGLVTDADFVAGLKAQQALVTNGPFVTLQAVNKDGAVVAGVGETASVQAAATALRVRVQTASWVDARTIVLYENGTPVQEHPIPTTPREDGTDPDDDYTVDLPIAPADDAFYVVEVLGEESLFPVVTPAEQPPVTVADALGGLAAGFAGAFGGEPGVDSPDPVQDAKPYALTNPVWVEVDGIEGFSKPSARTGPGASTGEDCVDLETSVASLQSQSGSGSAGSAGAGQAQRQPSPREDVRAVFNALQRLAGASGHGHAGH